MKNSKFFVVACLILGLVCCVSGCKKNPGYVKVTGTVTFEGAPLDGASLMFYSQESGGEGGGGKTGADGTYTVTSAGASEGGQGLLPGTYKVTVAKYEDVKSEDDIAFEKGEIDYDELQKRKAAGGAYAKTAAAKPLTPAQYIREDSTPLSITVEKGGNNVFDFTLE